MAHFYITILCLVICVCFGLVFFIPILRKKVLDVYKRQGVAGLLILSVFPKILPWAAQLLGIWWPPASLIFFFLIVIILIILRHTITISSMETEIKELAMQIALLKDENTELENRLNSKAKGESADI